MEFFCDMEGKKYKEFNTQIFSQQFWGIVGFSAMQVILYLILLNCLNIERNKYYVFTFVISSIIIVLSRIFISIILQASNRMKEYSILLISERIIYAFLLAIMLIGGVRDFKFLLAGDLFAKLISLLYGIFCCKNIVLTKIIINKGLFLEAICNIRSGVFIVLSNLCSMLITGIVQLFY